MLSQILAISMTAGGASGSAKPSACQVSADSYTVTSADSKIDTFWTSRQMAVIAVTTVLIQPGLMPVM